MMRERLRIAAEGRLIVTVEDGRARTMPAGEAPERRLHYVAAALLEPDEAALLIEVVDALGRGCREVILREEIDEGDAA